jgi:AcrR family transcriptional regulator
MRTPNARPQDERILTPQLILEATEDMLRRFGPAKATVADVARSLRVSPGSIYRHFPSKVALREAVTRDWLDRIHAGLGEIAEENGPAPERLERWVATLFDAKRRYARQEPELFATYLTLVGELGFVETEHLDDLIKQLQAIIAAGVGQGAYRVTDPAAAAKTVVWCATRFNHPLLAPEWAHPGIDDELRSTVGLINAGLGSGASQPSKTKRARRRAS